MFRFWQASASLSRLDSETAVRGVFCVNVEPMVYWVQQPLVGSFGWLWSQLVFLTPPEKQARLGL